MINFPLDFGKQVRSKIDKYRIDNNIPEPDMVKKMYDKNQTFLAEELEYITSLNLRSADIRCLGYFKNLETLIIDSFPSINDNDFRIISQNCPRLRTLVLKNQAGLKHMDVSSFRLLQSLSVVSNEHLVEVSGLEDLTNIDNIEFYDNVGYKNIETILDYVLDLKRDLNKVNLDVLYYVDMNSKLLNKTEDYETYRSYFDEKFSWSEKIGFKRQSTFEYTTGNMQTAYKNAMKVVRQCFDKHSSDIQNFVNIYLWMTKNVNLVLSDDSYKYSGTPESLSKGETNAMTFAKIIQFVARIVGIEIYDINNIDSPVKEIRDEQGTAYMIPENDYFILRTQFDDKIAYSDPVLDSLITQASNNVSTKYLLLSKVSFLRDHRIVGELSIPNHSEIGAAYKNKLVENAFASFKAKPVYEEKRMKSYTDRVVSLKFDNCILNAKAALYQAQMSDDSLTFDAYKELKNKLAANTREREKIRVILKQYEEFDKYSEEYNVDRDISVLNDKLGISITNKDIRGNLKSKEVLDLEKKHLIRKVENYRTLGVFESNECNALISRIEYVYNTFMDNSFAVEEGQLLKVA